MNFHVCPKKIFSININLLILLLGADLFAIIIKFYFEEYYVEGLLRIFMVSYEKSIPTSCEELLEMLGIAIFNFTLLKYMVDEFESVNLRITPS